MDEGRASLMANLGGREPSDRERWEQRVEFWTHAAETSESAALMLEQVLAEDPSLVEP